MKGNPQLRQRIMIVLGIVAVLFIGGILLVQPVPSFPPMLVRFLALAGYLGVFVAALSSLYMRELVQIMGRPFIKIHHAFSLTALGLLVAHGLSVAITWADASVLIPTFSPLSMLFRNGGRVAIYLLVIAVVTAWQRKALSSSWRWIHLLNYVAFLFATAHANLLAGNFGHPIPRVVSILMALVLMGVLVLRRVRAAKRGKKG
jgi:methionine sulfoxide reductase heme-binding subunit